MNTKYYTSIEQSKRLLGLGLDPESADKVIVIDKGAEVEFTIDLEDEDDYNKYIRSYPNNMYIPCWSLGALLEVMPIIKKDIDEYLPYFIKGSEIWKGKIQSFWYCSYALLDDSNVELITFQNDTAVEAAYSMVVWLLENGFIKKESKTSSE